ncbi:MAG: hypothetical protein CMO21_05970 [Thioclava sp.]|nr:hypothetical protein [Thioclava sp.]
MRTLGFSAILCFHATMGSNLFLHAASEIGKELSLVLEFFLDFFFFGLFHFSDDVAGRFTLFDFNLHLIGRIEVGLRSRQIDEGPQKGSM